MVTAALIRILLEASSLEDARIGTVKMIYIAIRRRIYFYAQKNFIVDFSDITVEQRHRDRKSVLLNNAQSLVGDANAATTVNELMVVYDQISQWLR